MFVLVQILSSKYSWKMPNLHNLSQSLGEYDQFKIFGPALPPSLPLRKPYLTLELSRPLSWREACDWPQLYIIAPLEDLR